MVEVREAGTEQTVQTAVEGSVCSPILPCPTASLAAPGSAGNRDAILE